MKPNPKIYLTLLTIGLLFILQSSCKKDDKEDPKPFTVDNMMTPTSASHGSTIQWSINITNLGEAITITKVHAKFVCTSGWAKGQVLQDIDLPITNGSYTANESRIIFSSAVQVLNSGTTNVDVKNTVTAYYNGGSVTDVMTYQILKAAKKTSEFRVNALLND